MRDKTMKVLGEMEEMARDMVWAAENLYYLHGEAVYEYDRLNDEDEFLTGTDDDGEFLAEGVDEAVDGAVQYTKDFREELAVFDKELMKLIALRGKLAEQLDIPIGGAKWVRYETYTM
jgi:hypothetical protein